MIDNTIHKETKQRLLGAAIHILCKKRVLKHLLNMCIGLCFVQVRILDVSLEYVTTAQLDACSVALHFNHLCAAVRAL